MNTLKNFDKLVKKIIKRDSKYDLKVQLKEHPIKNTGLFAIKPIKKGEVIAHYKIGVYVYKGYTSPTNNVYTFNVYRKSGSDIKKYVGDINEHSFPLPINNIPFWGPFANEPSKGEVSNAEIDLNLDANYASRKTVKEGDTLVYDLVAIKNIKKGDEILWYYGEDYLRNYEVSKK
jgi:hypothetical protein